MLRSFPDRFNPKVFAIEELNDLKTLPIDQLLGTPLTVFFKDSNIILKYSILSDCFGFKKTIFIDR